MTVEQIETYCLKQHIPVLLIRGAGQCLRLNHACEMMDVSRSQFYTMRRTGQPLPELVTFNGRSYLQLGALAAWLAGA